MDYTPGVVAMVAIQGALPGLFAGVCLTSQDDGDMLPRLFQVEGGPQQSFWPIAQEWAHYHLGQAL
jgi:hypothetical protein